MRFHIVEELYINNNSKVVRILNDVDNTTGIVKIYNQDYYKSNYFSIKKEYDFLKKLSPIEGVLKYYDFFEYENTKAIYMEDIDGISLKKISEIKRLDLEEIIDIIIKIVKTLEKIHENSFIHGNLSLENIIYNENTKKLRLIDFNENSQLANRKINSFINIDKKAFNYYSSPEQCGLINRSIDYRTDFYTVGILFYELVAGKNLFNYNNYKELIYKISYLENRNLEKDYSAIPTSLFDIINMLINKKPENRYRSSQGIINDLLSLKKIILSNELDKLFFVGQDDISEFNYRETEKLSGRDSQIEILKENFNSLNNNDRQVVFIQGEKGVGKTYLVSDFKEYVFKENGIFLNCQLDEFNIKRPLYNLNYLHNELFNLILLGEESIKENIKRDYIGELDENLKDNFKTIGESSLINYEKIINDIDINSEIMIEQYIQKLLKVISKNNIFMVLVFDDFNYIDKSSFKFIESVLLDNEIKNILIVVNYNKEESKVPKIVYDLKQFISENTISFVNIRLDNLNKIELSSYIYDSFMMIESNDDLDRIIDYIFEITKGNFKFAKEMLKYVNDLDVFISDNNVFKVDNNKLNKMTNMSYKKLINYKLSKLSKLSKNFLEFVSCIGNRISKKHILELYNITSEEFYNIIIELTNNSIIDNYIDFFVFKYDLDRKCIYDNLDEEIKRKQHYKIGMFFIKNLETNKMSIFPIIEHYKRGIKLSDGDELLNMIELYYKAALTAKMISSYNISFDYLMDVEKNIQDILWQKEYKLLFDLYLLLINVCFKINHCEIAIEKCLKIIRNLKNVVDKNKIYIYLIKSSIMANKAEIVLKYSIVSMRELGIDIPKNINVFHLAKNIYNLERLIKKKKNKMGYIEMIKTKEKEDIYKEKAIEIIDEAGTFIFFISTKLYMYLILKKIEYSIRYSNSIDNLNVMISYCLIMCNTLKRVDDGYDLGKQIYTYIKKNRSNKFDLKSELVFNVFIRHWKEPVLNCIEPIKDILEKSLQKGLSTYGANSTIYYAIMAPILSYNLLDCIKNIDYNISVLKKIDQQFILECNLFMKQVTINLINCDSKPWIIKGEYSDEQKALKFFENNQMKIGKNILYAFKIIMSYIFDNFEDIEEYFELYKEKETGLVGTYLVNLLAFYEVLTMQEIIKKSGFAKKKKLEIKINGCIEKIKQWSFYAPKNYLHKYYLLEGQRSYFKGNKWDAEIYFKKSIDTASRACFYNEEALCNEKIADFNYMEGFYDISRIYYNKAISCYEKWGAYQKVKHLLNRIKSLKDINYISTKILSNNDFTNLSDEKITKYIKISQNISRKMEYFDLVKEIIKFTQRDIGSEYTVFLEKEFNSLHINAYKGINDKDTFFEKEGKEVNESELPVSVLNFCINSKEFIILNNAFEEGVFADDRYIHSKRVKSLLCIPIIRNMEVQNVIYMENNTTEGIFSLDKLEIINIVLDQISISIENSSILKYINEFNESLNNSSLSLTDEVNKIYKKTQKAYYNIKKMTNYDKMTELTNRRTFIEKAKGELIRYEMTNSKFSIVLIKIKNLNYYIDKYGLKCSDYINKEIAKLLVDNTRCTDNIAKWDDDKFILLLTETILVKAKNFVERIKEIIIDKDIFFNGHLIELDLIFGLSEIDKEMKIEDCIKYTSELMRNKEVQGDSTLLIGSP